MLRTPPITKNLIIINVLMFFALQVGERWGLDLNEMLGLHFIKAPNFHFYQLFTYMFMHANLAHIFFNMFALWMFGRVMENVWGPRRYLLFYLLCGIGAGVMQEVAQTATYYIEGLNNFQMITDGVNQMSMEAYLSQWTTIGASGACYAILLGFGMTFPNERILLLIPPIPLKAKYFVIAYIVIELVSAFGSQGDSVAHFAHLGGMLFGWLIIRYWRHQDGRKKNNFTSWEEYNPQGEAFADRMRGKWNEVFGKKKDDDRNNDFEDRRDDYDYNARKKASQEEIDRLLEKIKRSGYDSLTEEEKRKLFDAGKK